MLTDAKLEAVPAYYATARDGRRVPFITTLLFYDANGRRRITPAVEKSIDRLIDITGRQGVATAIIMDGVSLPLDMSKYLERAMDTAGVIALFLCQSEAAAERVMQYLDTNYCLTLVRTIENPRMNE